MSMFLIASILFIGGGIIVALPVACVLLFSATRYEIRARRNPKRSERLTYHIMGTFGILLIDVILICSGV
ncbi:MAG: hypothetical protein AB7Q00_00095 [Phycisphaerales bacterium]|nr:MAG: hypothetical protein IPK69_04690 [Phycisphaerales bacterium]